jgi:hypothetical protein
MSNIIYEVKSPYQKELGSDRRTTGGRRAVFLPRGEAGSVVGAGWGGSTTAAAPRRGQGRPVPASRYHLVVAGRPFRCLVSHRALANTPELPQLTGKGLVP